MGGVVVYSVKSARALFDIEVLRKLGYRMTHDSDSRYFFMHMSEQLFSIYHLYARMSGWTLVPADE